MIAACYRPKCYLKELTHRFKVASESTFCIYYYYYYYHANENTTSSIKNLASDSDLVSAVIDDTIKCAK